MRLPAARGDGQVTALLGGFGPHQPLVIASTGHVSAHVPQSVHFFSSIVYFASPSLIASTGQTGWQEPHDTHSSLILYATPGSFR
jgi:hypothetical protein